MRLGFLHCLWKLPVCGLAFMVGIVAGSLVAGAAGMSTPDLPAGTDQATLRVVHSLEILADEMVYAGALVILLLRAAPARQVAPAA